MNLTLRVFFLLLMSYSALTGTTSYANTAVYAALEEPPEVYIKIDPNGGFSITPLTTPPLTTTISYSLIPDSGETPTTGTIGTNQTITVNEPWTGDYAEIELCYLNSANAVIQCNTLRLGDGVIVDSPIVVFKREDGENEECSTCNSTEYQIKNNGTLAELGGMNESISYLIYVDTYKFYFENTNGTIEYVRQCEGTTLDTEFMKNGIRFSFEGTSLFTIEASDLGDDLFLHLQNHSKTTVHKFIQACERT